MILVLTNEQDITSDYVVLELRRRGLPFVRLNTERLSEAVVSFDPRNGEDSWVLQFEEKFVEFSSIRAAYFRRPGTPAVESFIKEKAIKKYCETEWSSVLTSALQSLGKRWLNSPMSILAAENKPRQLSMALRMGFTVPETLITNDFDKVRKFMESEVVVAKPLREALLKNDKEERVIFTNRVDNLSEMDRASITMVPAIYQKEIKKRVDIRVTVIGDLIYTAEIWSQDDDETKTDWRRGSKPDLPHNRHILPDDISRKCIQLVHAFGLRFGAIDLVMDEDDDYLFLEVNPNGQWAWIQNRTGLPLTDAIVDELERIASIS